LFKTLSRSIFFSGAVVEKIEKDMVIESMQEKLELKGAQPKI
jgi:hypothetical protein